jgi:hypothetical protein
MRLDEIPPDVAYTRDQASRNIPDRKEEDKVVGPFQQWIVAHLI